ncbi:MAG: DUF5320 domain-containing protein [Nitrososphaerota archaeon]|nr:DUF5320 domain-containing protein [Nitrososphaerota archaeon]
MGVEAKARETVKSAGALLEAVKNAVNAKLSKTAPKVANALDGSFDKTSKTLTDTLEAIDQRTGNEQVELLKAYRSFLQKQSEIIDKRIESMKRKGAKSG